MTDLSRRHAATIFRNHIREGSSQRIDFVALELPGPEAHVSKLST